MPMPAPSALRQRWQAWWMRRHPCTDAMRLDHRQLYILPTASGLLYGILLVCLLVASINYQLSLGHLLTFTLASAALIALHATHATLSGLHLRVQASTPDFVGQTVEIEITLEDDGRTGGWRNPARFGRYGLVARWRDETDGTPVAWSEGHDSTLRLRRLLSRRGRQALPPLELSSRFPLGLFRVWTVWRIAHQPLAWPMPEVDAPPLPLDDSDDPADAPTRRTGMPPEPGDDAGVRPWRREDRPAQVLWRRSARSLAAGGGLIVREMPPPRQSRELHLDGDRLAELDTETRLRRLSAWVQMAEAEGLHYRMSLGPLNTEAHVGAGHRRHCLDALALWGTT